MNFEVSEAAFLRISELLSQEETKKTALRIQVDGGGCSGFMYSYNLIDKVEEEDFTLEKHGAKIAIDPLSQKFLDKCRLEFIEELGASYFQISNPSATAKCGCGNSFSL